MSDARRDMLDLIQDAIQGQLRYMLQDPGPWIDDVEYGAEDLAGRVLLKLTGGEQTGRLGGWLIQHYGEPDDRVREVIEFDMQDSADGGHTWTVYTKRREDPDDDD